jgi:hypothetical protein
LNKTGGVTTYHSLASYTNGAIMRSFEQLNTALQHEAIALLKDCSTSCWNHAIMLSQISTQACCTKVRLCGDVLAAMPQCGFTYRGLNEWRQGHQSEANKLQSRSYSRDFQGRQALMQLWNGPFKIVTCLKYFLFDLKSMIEVVFDEVPMLLQVLLNTL